MLTDVEDDVGDVTTWQYRWRQGGQMTRYRCKVEAASWYELDDW